MNASKQPEQEMVVVQHQAECRPLEQVIKTMLAVLFFVASLMLNAMLIVIMHERVPLERNPLPDIAFDLLPYWAAGLKLVERYMTVLLILFTMLCICHRAGHRIAQRFCVISGIVYILRAISFSVTQLPPPTNRYECAPKIGGNLTVINYMDVLSKRTVVNIFTAGMDSLSNVHYCGDIIFSGHTTNIVLSHSFLSHYLMPLKSRQYSYLWLAMDMVLFVLSLGALVLILVARYHYLADVLFAYYISSRTFDLYHTLCAYPVLHTKSRNNFFTKFWWWPLFIFFEKHAEPDVASKGLRNPFRALSNCLVRALATQP